MAVHNGDGTDEDLTLTAGEANDTVDLNGGNDTLRLPDVPTNVEVSDVETIIGGSANNTDTYRVVVTGNTAPAATSNAALLTVSAGSTFGFDLHTLAGCRLTSFAGSGAALNSEVGTQVVATAHHATSGALVATSATLTADSNSRLPRWSDAALSAATVYLVLLWPQDGRQPYGVRLTTT